MKLNRSTTRRPRRRQSHHHHPSRAPRARMLSRRRGSRGTAGGGWSCPGRRRGRRRGQSGRRRFAPLHWGRRRGGVHGRELNQRAAKGSGSKIRGERDLQAPCGGQTPARKASLPRWRAPAWRAPPHGVGRRRRLSSDPHAAALELRTPAVMASSGPCGRPQSSKSAAAAAPRPSSAAPDPLMPRQHA